jgi:hypothetical protein
MDLRMRRLGLGTTLAVDADAAWDRGVGTCVYDVLMCRFGAVRDVKRGGMEYLRNALESEQSPGARVDTLAHGVTTRELCCFARAHGLRLYAARVDGHVFHKLDGNDRKPALAFAVANGHMFPVTDPREVSYMAQRGRLRDEYDGADRDKPDAPDAPVAFVDEREALERIVRGARGEGESRAGRGILVVATADLTSLTRRGG